MNSKNNNSNAFETRAYLFVGAIVGGLLTSAVFVLLLGLTNNCGMQGAKDCSKKIQNTLKHLNNVEQLAIVRAEEESKYTEKTISAAVSLTKQCNELSRAQMESNLLFPSASKEKIDDICGEVLSGRWLTNNLNARRKVIAGFNTCTCNATKKCEGNTDGTPSIACASGCEGGNKCE